MSASTMIELVGLIAGGGGGGTVIARLTRLVIAVENLAAKIEQVTTQQTATAAAVQDHENRLNRAKL